MIRQLSRLGDIENTDKIRTLICTHQVSEARKEMLSNAYDYYVQYNGLTWIKPRFTREEKPIFLPLESELDQLISNARDKMSIFLQFLKETGADSGEAWKLRWIAVNVQINTVAITPTKNHNARTRYLCKHDFKAQHFATQERTDFRLQELRQVQMAI